MKTISLISVRVKQTFFSPVFEVIHYLWSKVAASIAVFKHFFLFFEQFKGASVTATHAKVSARQTTVGA